MRKSRWTEKVTEEGGLVKRVKKPGGGHAPRNEEAWGNHVTATAAERTKTKAQTITPIKKGDFQRQERKKTTEEMKRDGTEAQVLFLQAS